MENNFKNHILTIYVHSKDKSCYSGSDFNGYLVLNSEEEVYKFIKENNFEINKVNIYDENGYIIDTQDDICEDSSLSLKHYTLKSYSYNNRRKQIEKLFTKGTHPLIKQCLENIEKRENLIRQENGYVIHKKFNELKAKDYYGNLSKLITPYILKYLSSPGVHGYLGSYNRKLIHDSILEEEVSKIKDVDVYELLSVWLTSTDGRHFMDNADEYSDEEFREKVQNELPNFLIKGFLYDSSIHNGTLKSSIDNFKEIEDNLQITFK